MTWAGTALAFVAMVVGFLVVAVVILVRQHVLDEGFYAEALVDADAYERVYTDVLADPELADAKEDLLGGLDLGGVEPASGRILATNSLRWAVPPSVLRDGTERFIAAMLAYLRGDTDRIDGAIDVQAVLADLEEAVVQEARAALAPARDVVATSLDDYRAAVAEIAASLTDGRVPSAVPIAADTLADTDVVAALVDQLGSRVDADLRSVIEAQVAAGNEHDAAITALTTRVTDRAETAEADLRGRLTEGRRFDTISELADRAGSERRVLQQLNTVRDAASWFNPVTLGFGLVVLVAGAAGLALLHRGRGPRAVATVAAGLVLAGAAMLAVWLAVRLAVDPPLGPATDTGQGTWNLPAGLRDMLRDVESRMAGALGDAIVRLALVPIVAGTVLGIGAVAPSIVRRLRPTTSIAIATGVALLAATIVWVLPASASDDRACNGHVELCDRHYDEVVQAATHNSMSSPDVVEVWPEHDGTIREQLDAGVRALLIDTHYWTAVTSPDQLTALDPRLPPELATRVIDGAPERLRAHEGIFLCHNNCVFGGEPLLDGLREVHSFLVANPDEVVTLIVQDETAPADTVAVFAEAGLEPFLYQHEGGADRGWPTLGEMIDAGQRLVVFAENEGPPPAWYHPAFAYIQDTPFQFATPEDMSCEPNRGPPDVPLLLINHWLSPAAPDRRSAAIVNAHDVIVERARRCEAERGQLANFIAVDFYGIGDLLGAVDTLNGLGD